jgi:membrane-associated phospholipid phosphatase
MEIDATVHAWFQANRHPLLTPPMLLLTYVHSTWGLLLLAAGLGAVLWRRGDTRWLLALLCSVPGAMLLNVALKHIVQRTRPLVEQPLLVIDTYSFPSGHAAGSAALYAFAAAWLLTGRRDSGGRAAIVGLATTLVACVATSRLYLGVHFLSDVLAGALVGLLWALGCVGLLAHRRKPDAPRVPPAR